MTAPVNWPIKLIGARNAPVFLSTFDGEIHSIKYTENAVDLLNVDFSLFQIGSLAGTATTGQEITIIQSGSPAAEIAASEIFPAASTLSGDNYLYLPGTEGNGASFPHNFDLGSGDFRITVECELDAYSGMADNYTLIGAISGGSLLRVLKSGALEMRSEAGVAADALSVTSGKVWVRAERSSGILTLSKSIDGTLFIELDTPVAYAGATQNTPSPTTYIGSFGAGMSDDWAGGAIYSVEVIVAGVTTISINPALDASPGDTSFTATTGQTVTVNQSGTPAAAIRQEQDEVTVLTETYDGNPLDYVGRAPRDLKIGRTVLSLEGASDYVSVLDSVAGGHDFTTLGTAITISAWLNLKAPIAGGGTNWRAAKTIFELRQETGTAGTNVTFSLGISANALEIGFSDDYAAGSERVAGSAALTTGTWYNIAATVDGNDVKLFVDGVLDASATLVNATGDRSVASVISNIFIGARSRDNGAADDYIDAWISELSLYDSVLTPAQIADFTNLPTGALLHIPFEDETADDVSGNNNHGTLVNGIAGAWDETSTDVPSHAWENGLEVALDLPGTSGNYASVPSSAELDVTGDIELIAKLTANWQSLTDQISLIHKSNYGVYSLYILTNGTIAFRRTEGTVEAINSSVSVSFQDGETGWVKATLLADNGASGHTVRFFESIDGEIWTQVGPDKVEVGVAPITTNALSVHFGLRGSTIDLWVGKLHRAIIKDGIDGTAVLDIDFSTFTPGATSGTAETGQTVTINQSGSPAAEIAAHSLRDGETPDIPAYSQEALDELSDTIEMQCATSAHEWDEDKSSGLFDTDFTPLPITPSAWPANDDDQIGRREAVKVLTLAGAGNRVTFTGVTGLTATTSFSCWIKTTDTQGVLIKRGSGASGVFALLWDEGNTGSTFDTPAYASDVFVDGSSIGATPTRDDLYIAIADGEWHFIEVTLDLSDAIFSSEGVMIGNSGSTIYDIDGQIADYKLEAGGSEIINLPLEGDLLDTSGNGNNGTLVGATGDEWSQSVVKPIPTYTSWFAVNPPDSTLFS